jgi:diguanylate cyclase (GGDEF)-like protein/putative nucleotidyltransferase with HDIG domain
VSFNAIEEAKMAVPIFPRPSDADSYIASTYDIAGTSPETERVSENLARSQRMLQLEIVAAHTADLILILDAGNFQAADAPIVYASPAVMRMTGYTSIEVVGQPCRLFFAPEDAAAWMPAIGAASTQAFMSPTESGFETDAGIQTEARLQEARLQLEARLRRKDGSLFRAELECVSLDDQPDRVNRTVIVIRDITDRKQTDQRLATQAAQLHDAVGRLATLSRELEAATALLKAVETTDRLTGLRNYGALQEVLESEFQQAQTTGVSIAFAIIDLDEFHQYNQTHGYAAGDEALKILAQLLQRHARRSDVTARYRGDKFAMLLPATDQAAALELAEKVRSALKAVLWAEWPLTISIGIATVSDRTRDSATLLAHAELALFHCKKRGGNCVHCYDDVPRELHARAFTDALLTLADQTASGLGGVEAGSERLSSRQMQTVYDATIAGWSCILDLRDHETEGHSERVTEMTERLARALGVSEEDRLYMRWGALLHDIGKIAVPDSILRKPGPLTEAEWEVMRRHPQDAYEMLAPIDHLNPALAIPWCHHEKWDGSGYPHGLSGEQIPLAARIFAIVDVYDALRSDRPYRAGWLDDQIRDYIRAHSGSHFDPTVAEAFMAMLASSSTPQQSVVSVRNGLCEPREAS